VLAVQRAVKAWNHLERKDAKLVVLSAAHRQELLFGYFVSPQNIFGALRPDDRGMSLERDLRNIQDVVVMRVGDKDKVCSRDMRVNGR